MNIKYKKKIDYILSTMDEILSALRKYKSKNEDAKFFYYAAQKKTEEAIETAISLNQEILEDFFDHITKSYFDSFMDLEKTDRFTKAELEKLANTAGFRNRLAHEYLDLDTQITLSSMEKLLKLYPQYIKSIKEWLADQDKKSISPTK